VQFFKDLSWSTFTAGFVAVLVGFTSSIAIVFQAAQAFGASQEMLASWVWAISIGMGLTTAIPSLYLRKPVMVAWSTPGAAVLASALIVIIGASGWFEALTKRIPLSIASALLAGVLARFGIAGFAAAQTALPLVLLMLLTYLLGKRFMPLYAVPLTLLFAILFVAGQGDFSQVVIPTGLTWPVFVAPEFSWSAMVSLALPLFVVTMASQNMPGVAAIKACGFGDERANGGDAGLPISRILTMTGLATLVFAPFGAFSLNLSAITAAMCMGPQAHPDKARRYTAAVCCGLIYIALGLFGATIMAMLSAFPQALVVAIAGLALMATIGNGLASALHKESDREAAMVTFLITLSGVVIGGVGSAFWGLLAGSLALAVQHYRPRKA
jgi:benzoate membrane transport protein